MLSDRYIMVTGGTPDPQARLTEVIDIIDPTRTCATLQDFPESMRYGMGGAIMNGSLIACGGGEENNNPQYCYKYENDAWSKFGQNLQPNKQLFHRSSYIVLRGKKKKTNLRRVLLVFCNVIVIVLWYG